MPTQDDVARAYQQGHQDGRDSEAAAQRAREATEQAERDAAERERTRIPPQRR